MSHLRLEQRIPVKLQALSHQSLTLSVQFKQQKRSSCYLAIGKHFTVRYFKSIFGIMLGSPFRLPIRSAATAAAVEITDLNF